MAHRRKCKEKMLVMAEHEEATPLWVESPATPQFIIVFMYRIREAPARRELSSYYTKRKRQRRSVP
jgi:hypothetical protein